MGCWYCFCGDLWAIFGNDFTQVKTGNLEKIRKDLTLAFSEKPCNETLMMLRKGHPVKIGSKSENFQQMESEKRITFEALKLLKEYSLPIIVETKSSLIANPEYFSLLTSLPKLYLIESLLAGSESVRNLFEPTIAPLDERLKILETFHNSGIFTSTKIEPLMPGINDSEEDLKELAEKLKGKVDSISFYNYRTSNYSRARKTFAEHGLDWDKMGRLNWNNDYLFEMEKRAFKIFREVFGIVACADWVNIGLENSVPNCCGLPITDKLYKYTWLYALYKISQKGKVSYSEIRDESDIILKKDKPLMEPLWKNGKSDKRYSLWDARNVYFQKYDEEGFPIFGKEKIGGLEAF